MAVMAARLRGRVGVPSRLDVAVAVAVGGLLQAELWLVERYEGAPAFPGSRSATAVFLVVIAVALAWRRRRPMASFAAVMACIALQSLATGGSEAGGVFLVVLVSTYSAVAYGGHPLLVATTALATIAVHDLRDPYITGIGDRFFALIFLTAGVALGQVVHHRTTRVTSLTEETERLRASADEQARRAVAAERADIARELHDVVAHSVSVMVVQALAAQNAADGDRDRALRAIETTGRQAMQEMRRLLSILRDGEQPPNEPQPGIGQIGVLVDRFRRAGMTVTVHERGDAGVVPPGPGLAVCRIVQEALTNVLKHAGTTTACVDITYTHGHVRAQISNDPGPGATVSHGGSGHGLIGMRERVALYGGQLSTGPRGDGGFVVDARIPLEGAATA